MITEVNSGEYWEYACCLDKLAFHGADTDTDTDTDSPNTATVLRPTHEDPREEIARIGCKDVWTCWASRSRCPCRRREMPPLVRFCICHSTFLMFYHSSVGV